MRLEGGEVVSVGEGCVRYRATAAENLEEVFGGACMSWCITAAVVRLITKQGERRKVDE